MRIAFLVPSLEIGGAERQLVALAKGLVNSGHQVYIAQFYSGGPLEASLDNTNVRLVNLNKKGRWDFGSFLLNLHIFLKDTQPELLHSYLGTPNILSMLIHPLHPGIRKVWSIRASNMDMTQYSKLSQWAYKVEAHLSRFPRLIIANSRAGKNAAIRRGFPADSIKVIFNGIDTERFAPNDHLRELTRTMWKVDAKTTLVGLPGRLDPMKGHRVFIEAIDQFAGEGVKFICIGSGPLEQELRAYASGLGLVNILRWEPHSNDMPGVFNALDLTISSSFGEGFSNIIGESMACNTPCLVTDVGDSSHIVGPTGTVIPPNNPSMLAKAITEFQKTKWKDKPSPRQRVVDFFDLESMVSSTENAYHEIMS